MRLESKNKVSLRAISLFSCTSLDLVTTVGIDARSLSFHLPSSCYFLFGKASRKKYTIEVWHGICWALSCRIDTVFHNSLMKLAVSSFNHE